MFVRAQEDEEQPQTSESAPPEAPAGPSGEEKGDEPAVDDADVDEGDLFGSDGDGDDDAFEQAMGAAKSNEPQGEPVEFALPRQPRPNPNAKMYMVRLPNILKIQPRPFDPETFDPESKEEGGDGGEGGGSGSTYSKAANVIRWRMGPDGKRQSNARIVRWSDGSMTLHIGKETLKCQAVPLPNTHLYSKQEESTLECHGIISHRLAIAPFSRESSTHKALSKDIARSHTKAKSRMQLISTTEDPEAKQREREKTWDDKERLKSKQALKRAKSDRDADQMLTTDFLDADDDDAPMDGNLGAIKRGFKAASKRAAGGGGRRTGRRASGGYASGGKRRRSGLYSSRRRGSDDEDDEDDDEEEDDEEEDEERYPGEMDGFIVGDEDEASGSDDEEEAVMSDEDDDDDDDEPKKKKKKGKKKKMKGLVDEDDE